MDAPDNDQFVIDGEGEGLILGMFSEIVKTYVHHEDYDHSEVEEETKKINEFLNPRCFRRGLGV